MPATPGLFHLIERPSFSRMPDHAKVVVGAVLLDTLECQSIADLIGLELEAVEASMATVTQFDWEIEAIPLGFKIWTIYRYGADYGGSIRWRHPESTNAQLAAAAAGTTTKTAASYPCHFKKEAPNA